MRPSAPYEEYGDMDDEIMQVMSRGLSSHNPSRSSTGDSPAGMSHRPGSAQASYGKKSSGRKKSSASNTPSDISGKRRSRASIQCALVPTRVAFSDCSNSTKIAMLPPDCDIDQLYQIIQNRLSEPIHSIAFQCDDTMVPCNPDTLPYFTQLLPRPKLFCFREGS
eukprot:TRINITY_DN11399_c0_g1_i1.p1 TRINITY_DN11399_c0_g1~~TRINITY_DN11399_c0_g1_i1.p1  ORF type:complete len:165 (+),score=26.38 TRINITY_DN11399_c0_g1_i1:856-1350(+)